MKALTKQEVYEWFADHPEVVAGERSLEFPHSSAPAIHFHYPTGEGQMAFFTRMLCTLDFDESAFDGGLLWMTTWGVWSPWTEDIGHKAIALMRNSKMVSHFMELPGQAFDEHEELEAAAFLLQPMLIGWDAYFYPLFKRPSHRFLHLDQPRCLCRCRAEWRVGAHTVTGILQANCVFAK